VHNNVIPMLLQSVAQPSCGSPSTGDHSKGQRIVVEVGVFVIVIPMVLLAVFFHDRLFSMLPCVASRLFMITYSNSYYSGV